MQINGQPVFVEAGTLSVDLSVGKRSQASATVLTDTNTHFQQYQQVQIFDQNGVLVFNGYITNPVESKPGFGPFLEHQLTFCDQHFLADKRRVAASYTNKTCGFIVQDILTKVLASEGVSVGQIYDGPTPSDTLYPSNTLYPGGNVGLIPQATFVYATAADAMDALVTEASSAGIPYYWQIDQNRQLWFVPYTTTINPTVVDGSLVDDGTYSGTSPSVTRANPTYRNTQYILGGVAQTSSVQIETRKGDGNNTTFTMSYDLASAPAVTVNSSTKNAGIRGLDSGKDWYWQQGSPDITQDSAGTKLVGTDTFQAAYIGQYPSVVVDSNAGQVSYEASIDGSSGIIEDVDTDTTITSISNGFSKASILLQRYGVQALSFQFATRAPGYAQGQLITVNYAPFGFYNAQMLVETVNAADQVDAYNIWYTVSAVQGPYDMDWVNFFSSLLTQQAPANSINIGVSQSLQLIAPFSLTVGVAMTLNTLVYACPLPSSTLFPSNTLFPC